MPQHAPDTLARAADWRDQAACRETDPELFFSDVPGTVGRAVAVCDGCPVIQQCGTWALAQHIKEGVWGGLTADERRLIHRRGYKGRSRGKQGAA
ncbi:WhiB family transcriptional regulator [Streptomyces youssoufiensis]